MDKKFKPKETRGLPVDEVRQVKDTTCIFFKRCYLLIFRKKGRKEKERERNITVWLPLTHPLLGT